MPSKSFRTSNSFFSQEEQKPKRTKLPKGMKPVNANPEPTEEKASAPDIPEGFTEARFSVLLSKSDIVSSIQK